ncbi:hypothetical protein GOAMR_19_00070 [Gordonia amarae NBRC 15530]|uniref:Ribbon-helix-helix protein CopG domain-containing protein n=1 Tax=Gordonia amarae NBRC 15530 TaxID=1075090 RepID=G7GL45_9ACTN|nr:hypothetical protein GOAMR_19_00070 [Gordonia amarae NBRC 15530]
MEVVVVTNVLIRGISEAAVERIDAEASALGLSRNEYLRRKLEGTAMVPTDVSVTAGDWQRSAETFADLADPDVMDAAWR